MRLNNSGRSAYFNFLNTVTMLILAAGATVFLYERYKHDFLGWEAYLLLIIPILLIVWLYVRGRPIFEYDSEGEALNVKNRNIISIVGKSALNDEFPKYKLLKYELIDALLFRRLYLTITSKKKEHPIILKYDISYLTRKEVGDLKYSLSKIVKENKQDLQRVKIDNDRRTSKRR